MKKYFLLFLFLLCSCQIEQPKEFVVNIDIVSNTTDNYSFILTNHTNAFTLLKTNFDIEYTTYSIGPLITSINNITPAENEYWALYINNNYATVGINNLLLSEDTNITWKITTQ